MLDPKLPCFFRNAFVDALAKLALPRHAIEARQLLPELNALHHARPWRNRLSGRHRTATVICHQSPPTFSKSQPYCNFGFLPSAATQLTYPKEVSNTASTQLVTYFRVSSFARRASPL